MSDRADVDDVIALLHVPTETGDQLREAVGQQRQQILELSGERRLIRAMIEQAINDVCTQSERRKLHAVESLAWIATPDDDPIYAEAFSFDWCCEQLRMHPGELRKLVFESLEAKKPIRRVNSAALGDNKRQRRAPKRIRE